MDPVMQEMLNSTRLAMKRPVLQFVVSRKRRQMRLRMRRTVKKDDMSAPACVAVDIIVMNRFEPLILFCPED